MNIENEKRFLLLLSSYSVGLNKNAPTKSDVLDNIVNNNWMAFNDNDLELKTNRNELVWRNDLAFVRKHLEQKGWYVTNKRDNWGITDSGKNELINLYIELRNTTNYQKVTNEAIDYANKVLEVLDENFNLEDIDEYEDTDNIQGKEKNALIKIRVNQGKIRKKALKKYNCKCVLCNSKVEKTLIASHIKSWADSSSDEKGDMDNILLLCPNHDSLFDKHMISFDENGKILISNSLDTFDRVMLNVQDDMNILMNDNMKEYMAYHKSIFDENNN